MQTILLTLILIVLVVLIYLLLKRQQTPELLEYLKTTNVRLNEQNRNFNERLDNATRVIASVQKNIGEFSEIGRGMRDLQEFLKNPKLRGNIGEHVLKEMLGQFLPKSSFHLQYSFRSGEKVDAAIKTTAGIIPIDSKFPMENFRKMSSSQNDVEKKTYEKEFIRDVKIHIDAISKKYILTDEGTIDYALMYIPSEAVYYEVANNQDLFDYAQGKRVLPVSPTIFYAYIKAILMSFDGQRIEEKSKEILVILKAVQRDYIKVEDNLNILQKHLNNAYNMMGNILNSFSSLGQQIARTQSLEGGTKKEIKIE